MARGSMTKEEAADNKVTFLESEYDANLKCALTPDEVMAEAERMARLQQEIKAKEDEAASVNKRYKSEIEGLICQQDTCAGLVRDKFRFKTVRCMKRLDWLTKLVTCVRQDTLQTIEQRSMTVAESQMELEINDEQEAQRVGEGETVMQHVLPIIPDNLIAKAVDIIKETKRASVSAIQRRLKIGYTQAAQIIDILEERGVVGPANGQEPREVLIDVNQDEEGEEAAVVKAATQDEE
jgi:ribosomal protein S25